MQCNAIGADTTIMNQENQICMASSVKYDVTELMQRIQFAAEHNQQYAIEKINTNHMRFAIVKMTAQTHTTTSHKTSSKRASVQLELRHAIDAQMHSISNTVKAHAQAATRTLQQIDEIRIVSCHTCTAAQHYQHNKSRCTRWRQKPMHKMTHKHCNKLVQEIDMQQARRLHMMSCISKHK